MGWECHGNTNTCSLLLSIVISISIWIIEKYSRKLKRNNSLTKMLFQNIWYFLNLIKYYNNNVINNVDFTTKLWRIFLYKFHQRLYPEFLSAICFEPNHVHNYDMLHCKWNLCHFIIWSLIFVYSWNLDDIWISVIVIYTQLTERQGCAYMCVDICLPFKATLANNSSLAAHCIALLLHCPVI